MWLPQRIAAVPAYIHSSSKDSFKEAAPGHKFLGYLRNTQGDNGMAFAPYKGKARIIGNPPPGQPRRDANAEQKHEFDGVLNEVCDRFPAASIQQIEALRSRQQALHAHHGANGYRISTTSTAPFATGLGNEHPIENGFAFLTPYGLPYLAGSGVKGILRRAMQELIKDGEEGFTDPVLNALFGPELDAKSGNQPEDAQRGALDFWDVFPSPAGGKLVVEIMTPHYGKYYQGDETPHDSGAPVPVSFLAVPAKSQFDFHVVCQSSRLPAALQDQWRALLDRAFEHAFEWVGFGAKTSVGYGAMAASAAATPKMSAQAPGTHQTMATAAASPSAFQTWPAAKLTLNPGTGDISASFEGKSTTALKNPHANDLRAALGEDRANKLKKNKELKGVSVDVEPLGNALAIKRLTPS
jgi:CRISPR-associated protein Cmr6